MRGIKEALRWHYFQVKYAESWNESTDKVGIPGWIVNKLESNLPMPEIVELDAEAEDWCQKQLASLEPVSWSDVKKGEYA